MASGTLVPGQTRRFKYEVIADRVGQWSTQVRATVKTGVPPADTATNITVGDLKARVITTGPTRASSIDPHPIKSRWLIPAQSR